MDSAGVATALIYRSRIHDLFTSVMVMSRQSLSLSVIPRVLKACVTSSCSSLWHSWRASFDSWLLFEVAGGRQLQTKQLLQPELIVLRRCLLFKYTKICWLWPQKLGGYYRMYIRRKKKKRIKWYHLGKKLIWRIGAVSNQGEIYWKWSVCERWD